MFPVLVLALWLSQQRESEVPLLPPPGQARVRFLNPNGDAGVLRRKERWESPHNTKALLLAREWARRNNRILNRYGLLDKPKKGSHARNKKARTPRSVRG